MPAISLFDRSLKPVDFAHRPLWLVRGVDRSGMNDLVVGHRR
jgi:hypothetical protein